MVLLCCWRIWEALVDSFCFFSALCWASGGLTAVLRRAFLASGLEDGDPSIVLLPLAVLLPNVLAEGPDWPGSSVLPSGLGGSRVAGLDRSVWYRLLLPDSPSRRSKAGRSSHGPGESASGDRCKRKGWNDRSEMWCLRFLTGCPRIPGTTIANRLTFSENVVIWSAVQC